MANHTNMLNAFPAITLFLIWACYCTVANILLEMFKL